MAIFTVCWEGKILVQQDLCRTDLAICNSYEIFIYIYYMFCIKKSAL